MERIIADQLTAEANQRHHLTFKEEPKLMSMAEVERWIRELRDLPEARNPKH